MLRCVTVEQVAAAVRRRRHKNYKTNSASSCDPGTVDSILTTCTVCFTVFSHLKETNKWCSGIYCKL